MHRALGGYVRSDLPVRYRIRDMLRAMSRQGVSEAPHPGGTVRRLRTESGTSQTALATVVGCTQPFLSDIETAKRTPSPSMLTRIASALGVSAADLLAPAPEPET